MVRWFGGKVVMIMMLVEDDKEEDHQEESTYTMKEEELNRLEAVLRGNLPRRGFEPVAEGAPL